MKCSKCRAEMNDDALYCNVCGSPTVLNKRNSVDKTKVTGKTQQSIDHERSGIFKVMSMISFMISIFFYYQGYDKMYNYYSSENFSSLNKNSYVGGDAYNYIINGTYATSFFVLGVGFMLAGLLLIIINYIYTAHNISQSQKKEIIQLLENNVSMHCDATTNSYKDLPPL